MILVNNFKITKNGLGVENTINNPYVPIGIIVSSCWNSKQTIEFIQMNTGIIYYRIKSNVNNMELNWNPLHEAYQSHTLLTRLYDKFSIDLSYEISSYSIKLRKYFINNDKTNLIENSEFFKDKKDFMCRQELIYIRFNLSRELSNVKNKLESIR